MQRSVLLCCLHKPRHGHWHLGGLILLMTFVCLLYASHGDIAELSSLVQVRKHAETAQITAGELHAQHDQGHAGCKNLCALMHHTLP